MIGIVLLLLISVAGRSAAQEQKTIRVSGKLEHVMGIGGETTGWLLHLESKLTVDGKQVDSIEVDGPADKLTSVANKRVKAKGHLSHRHGVERGDWPVLVISSIQELPTQ